MTPEERFERIESILSQIATNHLELEAAQLNQQRAHTKLEESLTKFIEETHEGMTNLRILVDRLVARDLEHGEES